MVAGKVATNNFNTTEFIVDPGGIQNGATHTTIAGATADASSGDKIWIRNGDYTEDFTGKAGVAYIAAPLDGFVGGVNIIGKVTVAGTVLFSGIRFTTNSDFFLEQTEGASRFDNCYFNCSDNTGMSITGGSMNAYNCRGDVGTTGVTLFVISTSSDCNFWRCMVSNSGGTSTTSTTDEGVVGILYSHMSVPFASSTTGSINFYWSRITTTAVNATCIDQSGSTQAFAFFTEFGSGTAAAISVGASGVFTINGECAISSSNATPIGGSGRIDYSSLAFASGTANAIGTTTTNAGSLVTSSISFDDGTNDLDYYEEGTWSPASAGTTGAGAGTYTIQVGRYTRIGNRVYVQGYCKWTAHTGTGNLLISGLPFTAANVTNGFPALNIWTDSLTFSAGAFLQGNITPNATTGPLSYTSSAAASTSVPMDTDTQYIISAHYEVA